MTTRELLLILKRLQHVLGDHQYLYDALRTINDHNERIKPLQSAPTEFDSGNNGPILSSVEQLRKQTNVAISAIKTLSRRKIFGEAESLEDSLKTLAPSLENENAPLLTTAVKRVSNFSDIYDKFTETYSFSTAFSLFNAADALMVSLNSISDLASLLIEQLQEPPSVESKLENFELYFAAKTDFRTFLEKVDGIHVIYEEVCTLLDISTAQNPLQVVKIESGSLWTWLQGHPEAIAVICYFLKEVASYLYRNHTNEGRRKEIPRKFEELDSILKFSAKLREHGMKTEMMNETITKSAIVIAKQYEQILKFEEFVEINGEKIALTEEGQRKLVQNREMKLITNTAISTTGLD